MGRGKKNPRVFLAIVFFFLISFDSLAQTKTPEPLLPPAPSDLPQEFAAIRGTLLHFLSPLHPQYKRDSSIAELKHRVDESTAVALDKLSNRKNFRCYLSQNEIMRILFPSRPDQPDTVEKTFRFRNDCDVDGTVKITYQDVFRVDFTLKGYGDIFRIRFLMKMQGERDQIARFDAHIYDGEIYIAKYKYEPYAVFFADYSMVLDRHGALMKNTGGSIYFKTVNRKKFDRIFELKIE